MDSRIRGNDAKPLATFDYVSAYARRRGPTISLCRTYAFGWHGFPPSRERRCGAAAGGASPSGRSKKHARQVALTRTFQAGTNATAGFRFNRNRNFRRLLLRENLAAGRAKPRSVLLKAGHDPVLARYLRAAKPENVGSAGCLCIRGVLGTCGDRRKTTRSGNRHWRKQTKHVKCPLADPILPRCLTPANKS